MKHHHPTSLRAQGFTLIELLVVIGIIAILATIAVPVGQGVLTRARKLEAQTQMKGIEMAVKSYQTEYNRLPALDSPAPTEDNTEGYDTASADGQGIIEILMATDTTKNPRRVKFYEPPAAKSNGAGYSQTNGLRDTFGRNGYTLILDYDGDGQITNPYGSAADDKVNASVILYCAGPNKTYDVGSGGPKTDDIKSWE